MPTDRLLYCTNTDRIGHHTKSSVDELKSFLNYDDEI